MTPASSILHYLVAKQQEMNLVVFQTESEIAAINAAIGAAFAGVRAMTGTSGGGFALMTEALGLAAMTETPLVVMVSQRPGPSTGLATRTAQGDLRFVLHASQGEFPRFVIAPGDVNEAFYYTAEMFNLVEKYQVPGIILIDKYLSESSKTTDTLNEDKIKIDRNRQGKTLLRRESETPLIYINLDFSPSCFQETNFSSDLLSIILFSLIISFLKTASLDANLLPPCFLRQRVFLEK